MTIRILLRIFAGSIGLNGHPDVSYSVFFFWVGGPPFYKTPQIPSSCPTSTMKLIVGSLILCLGAVVEATSHVVQVAPGGSLTYSPSSLTAAVGDTVEFQFESNVCSRLSRLISESLCRAGCVLKSLSTTRWRCTRYYHF